MKLRKYCLLIGIRNLSTHNNKKDDFITITEKIKPRKDQYEVLKINCDMYYTSFSEYMQEAMKFDIEEGKLL